MATALDLSQGFYTIPLDKESQKICMTVTQFEKYAFQHMPMGITCAPDMIQSIMMELLGDFVYVLVYIDDVLILQCDDKSEANHLKKLETVLQLLEDCEFWENLRKSFFMQEEVKYLGYQLTKEGLKPQQKKLAAIERIKPPNSSK